VENPSNDLKIGQFVNVTVQMPPPKHEVVLPATSVVEDGRDSVVFVQPNPKEPKFLRRVVHVLRRFRDEIYVKSINGEVQPGDVIVTSGALMLQNALDQLPQSAVSSTGTVPEPAASDRERS
jgi:cobalt-zinc-cadmium efflux system membrane fusion protein